MTRPRVVFVVQRAGRDVNGGAEQYCLSVARALASRWEIEIVTTCARDYGTWADAYAPGVDDIDGVTVRRFPVDAPRAPAAFDRSSRALRSHLRTASPAEQDAWMRAQGPYSTPLLEYLAAERERAALFVFFTYLYATTYFGLPLVAEKALLVPFAHDEWMLAAPMWDAFFRRPAGFVFNTPEERALLERRFPGLPLPGPTIGIGVVPPARPQPERFRARFGIRSPFVVYVGRLDASKGIDRLLAHFARYKALHRDDDLQLVLVGRAETPLPAHPFVHAVGFLDEELKFDALAAAEALIQPSIYESLSIVVLEAWSAGRPVLVAGQSEVLVGQVRRAQGGLWFDDEAEFCTALSLLRTPAGARLGASGRTCVNEHYTWPRIVAAWEALHVRFGA